MRAKTLILATAAVAIFTAWTLSIPTVDPTPPQMATTAPQHPAVVLLEMPQGGRGSGVIVAPDWLLTCAHCASAHTAGGLPVASVHIAPGGSVDMALMNVPGLRAASYVPIAAAGARLHDPVSAYGYHLGKQFQRTDGYQGAEADEMSAQIIHGCSGGAVVNADGELLGVIAWVRYTSTWSGRDGVPMPHMAGYTPITDALRAWISETLTP